MDVLSPWIFVAAGVTTALAAMVTIGYQTIRASRMDPVGALRYE
jgi:ABC-type antimicrobial peptide transport system permease subunit